MTVFPYVIKSIYCVRMLASIAGGHSNKKKIVNFSKSYNLVALFVLNYTYVNYLWPKFLSLNYYAHVNYVQ